MKKVKFNKEVSEIHANEVSEESILKVTEGKKNKGIIMFDPNEEKWSYFSPEEDHFEHSLLELKERKELVGCEFYVLD